MCKFKDIIRSGYEDFKAQKKKNRISFALIVISLLIFVGVNSAITSILKSVNATIYYPQARIAVHSFLEADGDVYEKAKEYFKNDKRVRDVFKTADYTQVSWKGVEEHFGEDEVNIGVESFCAPIAEYVKGGQVEELEIGEALVPKDIYGLGTFKENESYDGENFVGETIELTYQDIYGSDMKTYTFKVVGTYDNVSTKLDDDAIYVNPEIMEEFNYLSYQMEVADYENFVGQITDMGVSADSYVVEYNKKIGIYVSEKYDIDEVLEDINEETGMYFNKVVSISEETYSFYAYIVYVANMVSFLLLVVAFLNIVISSMNEVKSRKWEFALKMSMGYTYRDILAIFSVEKGINMLKSLVVSVVAIGVLCAVGTFDFSHLMGRYNGLMSFTLDVKYVLLATLLVTIAAFSGVISGRNGLKNISVAETLKSGD